MEEALETHQRRREEGGGRGRNEEEEGVTASIALTEGFTHYC